MKKKKCPISRKNLATIRLRAIRDRRSGMKTKDIAAAYGVRPVSVSRWIGSYVKGGAGALRGTKSTGRPRKIECSEFFPKLKRIIKKPATKFGFSSPLWTSDRLRSVLKSEENISISQPTVWRALNELGMSYQKPERRAFEADEPRRQKWLKEEWPQIREQASKERAVILFEDEASVSLTPNIGKTWAKISSTPIVKFTGKKGSVSVISAVSMRGKLYFKVPPKTVDSKVFIEFLRQILREIPRKKIYMIVDGGSSHRSNITKKFVAKYDRLNLFFLPPYSPDFNPDEFTWARLKHVEMKAHNEISKAALRSRTMASMRSIQKKKGLAKTFIKRSKIT